MYDAATEARKAELDQAGKTYMAEKKFESIGRGKSEARHRDAQYERQRIREELEEDDERYWEKQNLDSAILFKEAATRLYAKDPSRIYDEELLKILWATTSELTTRGYERLLAQKQRREAMERIPTEVVLPPRAHSAALVAC